MGVIGVLLVLGKILVSDELIIVWLFVGCVILGLGILMVVVVVLVWVLGLFLLVINGLGVVLGIVGY